MAPLPGVTFISVSCRLPLQAPASSPGLNPDAEAWTNHGFDLSVAGPAYLQAPWLQFPGVLTNQEGSLPSFMFVVVRYGTDYPQSTASPLTF